MYAKQLRNFADAVFWFQDDFFFSDHGYNLDTQKRLVKPYCSNLYPFMTNADKIKYIRDIIAKRHGCTQENFAELIGVTRSTVARLESGIRPVSAAMKRKIKAATGAEILNEYDYPVCAATIGLDDRLNYERFELEHYIMHREIVDAFTDPKEAANHDSRTVDLMLEKVVPKSGADQIERSFQDWLNAEIQKHGLSPKKHLLLFSLYITANERGLFNQVKDSFDNWLVAEAGNHDSLKKLGDLWELWKNMPLH